MHATVDVLCQILGDNDKVPANPLLEILLFLTERDSDIPPQQVASFNQKLQEKGSGKLEISFIQDLFRKEIPAKLGAAPNEKSTKESSVKTPEAAPKDTDLEEL